MIIVVRIYSDKSVKRKNFWLNGGVNKVIVSCCDNMRRPYTVQIKWVGCSDFGPLDLRPAWQSRAAAGTCTRDSRSVGWPGRGRGSTRAGRSLTWPVSDPPAPLTVTTDHIAQSYI